jgi:hypothetical protein
MMVESKFDEQESDGRIVEYKYICGDFIDTAASMCDKYFNCQYSRKQLEEEREQQEQRFDVSPVDRVSSRLDHSLEVELIKKIMFEHNSLEPSFEEDDDADDRHPPSSGKGSQVPQPRC